MDGNGSGKEFIRLANGTLVLATDFGISLSVSGERRTVPIERNKPAKSATSSNPSPQKSLTKA